MDEKLADILWEDVARLDEAIVDLGDALDVKASIVLVLATLLGAISGPILLLHDLPPWVKLAQAIAVAALGFTVLAALVALWPGDFSMPPKVEDWEAFITESAADHKDDADGLALVETELRESRVRVAKRRIAANKRITDRKAQYNGFAFYTSGVAILMDVATLIWLARTHL